MAQVDVIAVVGACAPERRGYARRLSSGTSRSLIPSSQLAREGDPALAAASLALWSDKPLGAVVEFASTTPAGDIIGALTDPEAPTRLVELVCVVDAAHLLADLSVDDFLVAECDEEGNPSRLVARASLTVTQIEFASTIVLVGWEAVATRELSAIMALVSSLAPRARLRLDQGTVDNVSLEPYTQGQDRPGWIGVLNQGAAPYMTDPRIGSFRYEQLRPFHPERLASVLMHRFEAGEFGLIVRSAGLCRLASRPESVLQWDHVGRTIAFHLAADERDYSAPEPLTVGQEIAFIGIDLYHGALKTALDSAALTDEELTAGPESWRLFRDPFPATEPADDSTR